MGLGTDAVALFIVDALSIMLGLIESLVRVDALVPDLDVDAEPSLYAELTENRGQHLVGVVQLGRCFKQKKY